MNASTGYESDLILRKVLEATLKVKRGEAAFERDSVAFPQIEYSWPLVSNLMFAASTCHGGLDVVDFGGSLGSAYFQNIQFLEPLSRIRWAVVEQPHFVDVGRLEIEDERLRFFASINDAITGVRPQVLLLGSVLQYLPDPFATLATLLDIPWQQVIVDRTAFVLGRGIDRLTVQTVPPIIYAASYPAWFLSKSKFMAIFAKEYDLFTTWTCDDRYPLEGEITSFEGHCFMRKQDYESV